jgi:hypothetical protein
MDAIRMKTVNDIPVKMGADQKDVIVCIHQKLSKGTAHNPCSKYDYFRHIFSVASKIRCVQ